MQESRLFKILYFLLEKGQTTAPKLSQELEVSVRTIYRDIDALSSAGIPVYTIQGKGGGIYLMDSYVFHKGLLSDQEQQEILASLQSLSALLPDTEQELLPKMKALFSQSPSNWIQIDFSRWGNQSADTEKFNLIKEAILKRHLISFQYVSSYGEVSQRKVKPLKIHYKSHAWYLQTFCMDKESFRTFKINRMSQIFLLPEIFEDIPALPPIETPSDTGSCPLIKLHFKKEWSYRVFDEFPHSEISKLENGDVVVETHIPPGDWLYGYLLTFCGCADILEPVDCKNKFHQLVKEIYLSYCGSHENNFK